MQHCLIALGSNLGDRKSHLQRALTDITQLSNLEVVGLSRIYETAPVGGPDNQGAYLNAALLAYTSRTPQDLLRALHDIEARHERERTIRWGPRTLDLDLLCYGATISSEPDLLLPHPRMHQRRFVMVPVCDVAPDYHHPVLKQTMKEILNSLPIETGDLQAISEQWEYDSIRSADT